MITENILNALNSQETISGHTHDFYNHPARFHPKFAKAVIESFTQVGECVIDPFMGSCTTGVEALVCGRRFLGIDINPLSHFVAHVKTTPLTHSDFNIIRKWIEQIPNALNLRRKVFLNKEWAHYVENLPWTIRKAILLLVDETRKFELDRQKDFVKCGILSTGQWALNYKESVLSKNAFLTFFFNKIDKMIHDMKCYQTHVRSNIDVPLSQIGKRRKLLCCNIADIDNYLHRIKNWTPAKLVLTSPPYPGVHVVYNRWQIRGRKETSAPYWIMNTQDGNGLSYYTLGDRKQKGLKNYFENLKLSFNSIKKLLDREGVLVQLVGFSDPSWQLNYYLRIMSEIGLREIEYKANECKHHTRRVPNRKWYTQYDFNRMNTSSDREFLLIHKIEDGPTKSI